MGSNVEDEIDLRDYVRVLSRSWMWIVGLAVVAALVAFAVSSFLPKTYEATALVVITNPRYEMQFDPRFGTEERKPATKAFPALAHSDSVLQAVVDAYTDSAGPGGRTLSLPTLSGMATAASGIDPSLVTLKVRSPSAEEAAALANLWADTLVRKGNQIYGQGNGDVTFFEDQLARAGEALTGAETTLIEFEARNQENIVNAQLESAKKAQEDSLEDQRDIGTIVQDIQGLRQQLSQAGSSASAPLAESLTALFLQIRAFNAEAETPLQLQVDSATLSSGSRADQIRFLDDLSVVLKDRSTLIDAELAGLEPQILALQRRLQENSAEQDHLVRARDLCRETYTTLARKLEEARIAAEEGNGTLQVGSHSAVPQGSVAPRKLFNTAVGGVLGLMAGVFGAFAIQFWRQNG